MRRLAGCAIALASLTLAVACETPVTGDEATPRPGSVAPAPSVTLANGSKVVVEVVADPETRAQGLMFRSSLGPDRGMLFIFPDTALHSFWMKNTLIPLDIIWLDEARVVVHVERGVPPCKADPCPSYPPKRAGKYVLELAAGQAEARAIREGDRMLFEGIENFVAR